MGKTSERRDATSRRFRGHTEWQVPLPNGRVVFDPSLRTAAQLMQGSEVGPSAQILSQAA